VAVDIAPLKAGHLLATPHVHVERYVDLSHDQALELPHILDALSSYTRSIAFEFCGPATKQRGCVSHTHFHVLPVDAGQELPTAALVSRMMPEPDGAVCHGNAGPLGRGVHIRVRWNEQWYILYGEREAEAFRCTIEQTIAGTSTSWRERLADDEEEIRNRITDSIRRFEAYTVAV